MKTTIVVKATTKRGKFLIDMFQRHEGIHLLDVYVDPSEAKIDAFYDQYDKCIQENGVDFHICCHNMNVFTVAWLAADGAIHIETRKRIFKIYQ